MIVASRRLKKSRPLRPTSVREIFDAGMLGEESLRRFDQIRIEGAGQTFIAGDQHQIDRFRFAFGQPDAFRSALVGLRGLRQIRQHFAHLSRRRAGRR